MCHRGGRRAPTRYIPARAAAPYTHPRIRGAPSSPSCSFRRTEGEISYFTLSCLSGAAVGFGVLLRVGDFGDRLRQGSL
jgi:hypothetical protein